MKARKLLGIVLAALVVVLLVAYASAGAVVDRKLARRYATHTVRLQVPFPLPESTAARLSADGGAAGLGVRANLTPGPAGLGGWTFAQFTATMRTDKRPDGRARREPMSFLIPFTRQMTETELDALWSYLRSVPPLDERH